MSDRLKETEADLPKVRRLSDAVRKVRIAEAERVDAFSDLYEAEKARLGLLAEELDGVFAELPPEDGYFLFQVLPGMPPRFWVDATSHVVIARDRRTYRFLKDTRLGRTVIRESTDVGEIADAVTDYVAERVVERERALETDWMQERMRQAAQPATDAANAAAPRRNWGAIAAAFLFGIAAGVGGLVAYAWFRLPGV